MNSDNDETAVAGTPAPGQKPSGAARPISPETNPEHARPADVGRAAAGPKAPAEGDPNVTQVFRPQRAEADEIGAPGATEVTMGEDGTISDPVVAWLVVVEGPGRGSALPIGYGNNRLGRGPGEQICLDFGDEQISRENHAVVTYDGRHRKFYVQQGGGRNLTHVDDELVMVPVEVKGGETISVGRTKLRFIPFCGPDFDWQDQ